MPKSSMTLNDRQQADALTADTARDQLIDWNLMRLGRFLENRSRRELQAKLKISARQFGALREIGLSPGIGSREIARRLMITTQSAGPLVDGLDEKGFIEREAKATPGLRRELRLSPSGRSMLLASFRLLEALEYEDRKALEPFNYLELNRMLLHLLTAVHGVDTHPLGPGGLEPIDADEPELKPRARRNKPGIAIDRKDQ